MEKITDQVILSGIQPSGQLHLGNYLGAIKQWIALQEENDVYYCIVDLHAITVSYDSEKISAAILDTLATYLAAGLDPIHSAIFLQSDVPAHTELAWLLATQTPMGELKRMTQFKDKAESQESASLGLFSYPVLMAADILLYNPTVIPVGEDQTQHVELTRFIAKRFNNKFGETFKIPKPVVNKNTARIMSLTDHQNKMSKSDPNPKSSIILTEAEDSIRKKIMSAVTDTDPVFSFERSGPAVKNLLAIYQALSDQDPTSIEQQFNNANYKEFKESLADLVIEKLASIRQHYEEIRPDETMLNSVLKKGQEQAENIANQTLKNVKEKMGL